MNTIKVTHKDFEWPKINCNMIFVGALEFTSFCMHSKVYFHTFI